MAALRRDLGLDDDALVGLNVSANQVEQLLNLCRTEAVTQQEAIHTRKVEIGRQEAAMRGTTGEQIESLIALTPDDLVPQGHPIRRIKPLADRVLRELSPTFAHMYAKVGRPSVPPEHLLKASLLIALYSVRSERQFCERLTYDMLFRWFLDLNIRGGPLTSPRLPRTGRGC